MQSSTLILINYRNHISINSDKYIWIGTTILKLIHQSMLPNLQLDENQNINQLTNVFK